MNIFQLFGLLVTVGSAVIGARWGLARFGWPGFAGGLACGLIAGWLAGIGVPALIFFIGASIERLREQRGLRPYFGPYWKRDRAVDWANLVARLSPGETVSGEVRARHYYAAFVDTGHGFPACLGVLHASGGIDGPQPQVGDVVSARVREFESWHRVIQLTQTDAGGDPGGVGDPTPRAGAGPDPADEPEAPSGP